MKRIIFVSLIGFLVLSFAFSTHTAAGPGGPSANGDFQFSLIDGQVRYLKFDVSAQKNGETHGQMTFNDPSASLGDGENSATTPAGVSVTAEFDCLQVKGNDAVMSGVITRSNLPDAIGVRVLLVVQDNGEGINAPALDKLTWGIYSEKPRTWIARDAELEDDAGAFLTWVAKDFERSDDVGIPSNRSTVIGCQSFPLSSYSFVDVDHGFGNIQIRP